jgi:serine protease AprX
MPIFADSGVLNWLRFAHCPLFPGRTFICEASRSRQIWYRTPNLVRRDRWRKPHKDIDPAAVLDKLAAIVRLNPSDIDFGRHKVRLTVQEQMLPQIAALDEVHHIESAPKYRLLNSIARQILGLPSPNGAPGAALGSGQIVAVADTGFDKGSTTNVHPAFTGRVAKLYALGRAGAADDPDGHGTHVCLDPC